MNKTTFFSTFLISIFFFTHVAFADSYVVSFHESTLNDSKLAKENTQKNLLIQAFQEIIDPVKSTDNAWIAHYQEQNCYASLINACRFDLNSSQLDQIKSADFVKHVTPDLQVKALLDYSRPLIGATDLENLTGASGAGVSVAVLDTGIDYQHQAFGACTTVGANGCPIIAGYDFINNDSDPLDDNGHGTHVAGIIAGNGLGSPGNAMKGIAPQVNLMVYKVLDLYGAGNLSHMLMALEHVADPNQDGDVSDHADVLNLSLGFNGVIELQPLDDSLNHLHDLGVLIVAAAGNSGPAQFSVYLPASNKNALAVSASTHLPASHDTGSPDQKAPYSAVGGVENAYHGVRLKPEIIAPGGDIHNGSLGALVSGIGSVLSDAIYLGTGLTINEVNSYYSRLSGTSMAAPHVAGAAALLIELYPGITPIELRSRLMLGATDIGLPPTEQGAGRLQINVSADFPIITEPNIIDFAEVSTSVSHTLNIKNVSAAPVPVSLNTTLNELNNITISPVGPYTLQPGASHDFTIDFTLNHSTEPRQLYSHKLVLTSGAFTGDIPYSYYTTPPEDEKVGQFLKNPGEVLSIIEEDDSVVDLIDFDYDQDGDIDFITAAEGGVYVYKNEPSGYEKHVLYASSWSQSSGIGGLSSDSIYDLDVGDFDGDNKQDIVMVGRGVSGDFLTLLKNKVGSPVPTIDLTIPVMVSTPYILPNGDKLSHLTIRPDGTFYFFIVKANSGLNYVDYRVDDAAEGNVLFVADYQMEVLSVDQAGQTVEFRISTNPFETIYMKTFQNLIKSVQLIDGNGDGLLDVLVGGLSNSSPSGHSLYASLLINSGGSGFSAEQPLVDTYYDDPNFGTAFYLYKTKMIDVTADGHLDIVGFAHEQFLGEGGIQDYYALTYFENNGDFTFDNTPHVLLRRGERLREYVKYNHRFNGDFIIDDFDRDGLQEIVVSDASAQIEYFQLDGSNAVSEGIIFDFGQGTRTEIEIFVSADHHVPLVSMDWNRDGYKDLLLVSQHNNKLVSSTHVLINQGFDGPDLIFENGFENQ
ncbi:S8 family serine peptidase [Marinicella sp. W31]|uniref:S8 family serine peptidase n=1 Tax=Marinicella sp. W31 TaxID=3023713 RepID=UPI003757CFFB